MRAAPLALAAALATLPALAQVSPDDVPLTDQVARQFRAAGSAEAATAQLVALMERIGRPDGVVVETLDADRVAALEDQLAGTLAEALADDTGGDGAITRLELSRAKSDWTAQQLSTYFRIYDGDGDGRVTEAELEAAIRLELAEVESTELLRDLVAWDLDGDGLVTPAEVARIVARRFAEGVADG